MDKKVECKYRVTATIKADTKYELEVIKDRLIRAGATILHIDRITSITEEPSGPTKTCSLTCGDPITQFSLQIST